MEKQKVLAKLLIKRTKLSRQMFFDLISWYNLTFVYSFIIKSNLNNHISKHAYVYKGFHIWFNNEERFFLQTSKHINFHLCFTCYSIDYNISIVEVKYSQHSHNITCCSSYLFIYNFLCCIMTPPVYLKYYNAYWSVTNFCYCLFDIN